MAIELCWRGGHRLRTAESAECPFDRQDEVPNALLVLLVAAYARATHFLGRARRVERGGLQRAPVGSHLVSASRAELILAAEHVPHTREQAAVVTERTLLPIERSSSFLIPLDPQ